MPARRREPGSLLLCMGLFSLFLSASRCTWAHLRETADFRDEIGAAATRAFFQGQRTDRGEDLILRQNLFIEYLLPLRNIPEDAIDVYRRHYRNPGASRMPMLAWTRDLPIAGEPADVVAIVEDYARWLSASPIPKLFIDADPGGFLIGAQREFCRAWPNQETVMVQGAHFLQEEAPDAVARALTRFVANVRAGAMD